MRDRRNTNLSVSSDDSTTSPASRSTRYSLNEKRYSSPPPPSLSILPAPVSAETKSRLSAKGPSLLVKVLVAGCGLLAIWWCARVWTSTGELNPVALQQSAAETEWVGGNDLPTEPTALVVAGPKGPSKWTIAIPHNWTFPLPARYYKDMCSHGSILHNELSTSGGLKQGVPWWRNHHTYLDVQEAEEGGVLPPSSGDRTNVCQSTITVVLESDDASFGQTLMLLWLSYGLAKQQGRSFFIDDTRWSWGKYATYFKPASNPKCDRPAAHHVVPFPHSARHLVVSSATAGWTFAAVVQNSVHGVQAQRQLFELLRSGYKDLFHLTGEDSLYAAARIAKLKDEASHHNGAFIGMQIRRGDMHPLEYQYSKDYLPLERYTDGAHSLIRAYLEKDGKVSDSSIIGSTLALASDDPDIIRDPELQYAALPLVIQNAQERIQLASKATLDRSSSRQPSREAGSGYIKHLDENIGWEGGFYSALFFSLGGAKAHERNHPPDQALRLRELVGRAYLLDLAVLGESDGVICARSSATCRVLGIMMGWERVVARGWLDVDGSSDGRVPWSWDGK